MRENGGEIDNGIHYRIAFIDGVITSGRQLVRRALTLNCKDVE